MSFTMETLRVHHVPSYSFRFEPYVDERYKEFCKDQGKAEDVSVPLFSGQGHWLLSCLVP